MVWGSEQTKRAILLGKVLEVMSCSDLAGQIMLLGRLMAMLGEFWCVVGVINLEYRPCHTNRIIGQIIVSVVGH